MLLARHNLAHFGFAIFDDITTDIEGHAVDRTGEFEGGLVVESHGRTGISTDDETTTQSHGQRGGMRDIGLPDQLTIDIKLSAAGCALAIGDIRWASNFELEPPTLIQRKHDY